MTKVALRVKRALEKPVAAATITPRVRLGLASGSGGGGFGTGAAEVVAIKTHNQRRGSLDCATGRFRASEVECWRRGGGALV